MLEFDDIQHILLTRAPALTGRYEFLSFRSPSGGRAWLAGIKDKVHSDEGMRASIDAENRWVTVAFTWNGLRVLGVPEASLASFPEEFRQGMVARAPMLGDAGANHPDNWVGSLSSPDLHAIVSSSSPATPPNASAARVEHDEARCAVRRRRSAVVARPGGNAPVRSRSRSLWLSRPPLPAGHRRLWRRANARFRPCAEGGRIHTRLPGRTRPRRSAARTGEVLSRNKRVSWPIGVWRNMSARFEIF